MRKTNSRGKPRSPTVAWDKEPFGMRSPTTRQKINMIKKTAEKYTITKLATQTHCEVNLELSITEDNIEITSSKTRGDGFVFKSRNSDQTISRWEQVVATLSEAIKAAKQYKSLTNKAQPLSISIPIVGKGRKTGASERSRGSNTKA